MTLPEDPLEIFWDQMLSRDSGQIRSAFYALDAADRANVTAHLERMAGETGWNPEQTKSARIALEVISAQKTGEA